MIKRNLLMGLMAATVFTSCQKDDEIPTCESSGFTVPQTYIYTDADGNSTVSYNGQEQRLEMLSEMTSYLKTANTPGTAVDAQTLKDMYANDGYTWADADNLGMTGSSKQLKSKTAAGSGTADPAVQAYYENLMDEVGALSQTTTAGSTDGGPGQGGVVQSTTNSSKQYLQNANGIEYTQLIEKGLMGAVFYNQICVVYTGSGKMDVDNTTPVDPDNGKYYTVMEHHWDEAYGYFTTATDYPASGANRFWGKYANSREGLLGTASALSEAFRTGRAAITANDMDARDAQITIIRHEMERVAGGTAIHYLNSAVANFSDDALRNHALSEAWAFMGALPFGYEPVINSAELQALYTTIGDDFYAVTTADLLSVRDQLATLLNMEDVKESL